MHHALSTWFIHLGAWSYAIVFLFVFAESGLLLLLPGETVVIVAGILASRHVLALGPLIAVAVLAASSGDACGYLLGRGPARRRFQATGRFLFLRVEETNKVKNLLEKHGHWAIVMSRFVGVLRVASPFVCGLIDIPPRRFFPYNLPACVVWGAGVALLGDLGANTWQRYHHWIGRGSLVAGALVFIGVLVWNRRQRRRTALDKRDAIRQNSMDKH